MLCFLIRVRDLCRRLAPLGQVVGTSSLHIVGVGTGNTRAFPSQIVPSQSPPATPSSCYKCHFILQQGGSLGTPAAGASASGDGKAQAGFTDGGLLRGSVKTPRPQVARQRVAHISYLGIALWACYLVRGN